MRILPIIKENKTLSIRNILILIPFIVAMGCHRPKEKIVLKQIRDVVVDATTEPTLKANAILFNPNNVRGRLKKIDVEIFVNGKKAAKVDQEYNTAIPASSEFTIPLQVSLAIKELGFMDTLMGMLGGKNFEVHYLGSIKISYRGVPIRVPVDYKDNVRVRF